MTDIQQLVEAVANHLTGLKQSLESIQALLDDPVAMGEASQDDMLAIIATRNMLTAILRTGLDTVDMPSVRKH